MNALSVIAADLNVSANAVESAMSKLPATLRSLVTLKLSGQSGPEIATALNLKMDEVHSGLHRGMKTLRSQLA